MAFERVEGIRVSNRATYVIRNGELVEKHLAPPLYSPSDAPNVIRDQMDPLMHMANGKMSDSKSEHRRWTKEAGCIEVGTSPLKPFKPPALSREQRGRDIKTAIEQLTAR